MYAAIVNADFLIAIAIAIAIVLVSGILHGYTGFGDALLKVPLLSFRYGPVKLDSA